MTVSRQSYHLIETLFYDFLKCLHPPPPTPVTSNKQPAPKPAPGFGSGASHLQSHGKAPWGTRLVKGTPSLPLPSFLPFNLRVRGPDGNSEPGTGYKTQSHLAHQIQLLCTHFKYKFSASLYVTKSQNLAREKFTISPTVL